jgi:hypothetical protein
MNGTGRTWDRHQWAGAPAGQARGASEPPTYDGKWSLWQWVGTFPAEREALERRLDEPETSGGFSGFGVADSGGQRWATGYAPGVASEIIDLDELGVDERVA